VFQSVSTRTAGFNTVDIGTLSSASLLLVIILMFIGASPGSTGGGLKTTTFAVLWSSMMNGFSRNEQVEIHKRTIPPETLQKAATLLLFYILIVLSFVIALLVTEGLDLMSVLFESVSAVATVGLSTGITGQLSKTGRILITVLMFIGRLGPLTISYALVLHRPKSNYCYAEERVMIG
jgi:trk system potassium uptake protein TrkH